MQPLIRALAPCALLAASVTAQLPEDTWVATTFNDIINGTGGGGIHIVSADRTTYTFPGNQTANMVGANAAVMDGNGFLFYGTLRSSSVSVPNPGEIFQVILSGGQVVTEIQLTSQPPDTGSISGLTLRGDQIWYVTDAGNIGWIPRPSASNPPPFAPNNVFNINSQGGVGGLGQSITTDGREIFVGISVSSGSTDPYTIWALDAETLTFRGVAIPDTRSVFDMNMGRDGEIFAGLLGGRLYSIDPVTGASTQVNAGAPAPQANANGASLNPWTQIAGVVPGFGTSPRQLDHLDLTTLTWFPNPVGILGTGVPSNVTSAHDMPFELFGLGCMGQNGMEPRARWRGMPIAGQSFDITLRDADPNTVAFLVFGFSNQTSQFGPLPFDLGPLGASGCFLRVSTDIALLQPVDGSGNASLTINLPATLGRLGIFAQWGVVSAANGLGIVPTEAVRIRTR